MNYDEISNKLKQIKIENFIWVIYIGIIILSYYANGLEKKYFIFNDLISKDKYRDVMITIFIILVIVYLYFLKSSIEDINNLKESDSEEKKKLTYLSFLGSLFIAISGFIYLYISIVDQDIDVELAFN